MKKMEAIVFPQEGEDEKEVMDAFYKAADYFYQEYNCCLTTLFQNGGKQLSFSAYFKDEDEQKLVDFINILQKYKENVIEIWPK